jgi:muramoyltetrapeptide carboxypeptidase LdcA involved in peptidoglycan recycling
MLLMARADQQLEVAEGRRVTGKLYSDNIQTLVGKPTNRVEQLQKDLDRERCTAIMRTHTAFSLVFLYRTYIFKT